MSRVPINPAQWQKALAETQRKEQETAALPRESVVATEYSRMAKEAEAEMIGDAGASSCASR
jgi:hypothetical protein